jgi:hypothetical protein
MNSPNIYLLKHTYRYICIYSIYVCICKNGNIYTDCLQYKEAHVYTYLKRNILKCKEKYFTTQTMLMLADICLDFAPCSESVCILTSVLSHVSMSVCSI